MRLLGVVLVWAAIVCLLGVFFMGRQRPEQPASYRQEAAQVAPGFDASDYTLEVAMTFNPAADPFALPGDAISEAGLVIKQAGEVVFAYEPGAAPHGSISLNPAPGIGPGTTEYLVEASTPRENSEGPRTHAVRVTLLRDGVVLAAQSFWSGPDGIIRGVFRVELEPSAGEATHGG